MNWTLADQLEVFCHLTTRGVPVDAAWRYIQGPALPQTADIAERHGVAVDECFRQTDDEAADEQVALCRLNADMAGIGKRAARAGRMVYDQLVYEGESRRTAFLFVTCFLVQ